MNFRKLPAFAYLFMLFSLLLTSGCATLQSDAGSLQTRAEAYWKARVEGDLTAAFAYEELNARKKQTLQQYVKANAPVFLKATVTATSVVSPELASVTVDTEMRFPGLLTKKTMNNVFTEDWLLIEGNWFHKYMSANPANQAK